MALRVMIAGGGTGGHVIPALAIGHELRDRHNADCLYVGTARGIESRLVPEAGFRLELVRSGQLNRVSLKTRLKTLTDLPLGILHCIRLLRSFRPQVVVGVGGYASGPAMLAAVLLRVPTLVYEPNAVPGFTNRVLGKRVSAAAVNFPQTASFFRKAEVTGVPVRAEIFALPPKPVGAPPRLLVTAGSNGALIFNETLPRIAGALLAAFPRLSIMHQSGPRALEATRTAYSEQGIDPARCTVAAFLDDMPAQYAAADIVLARAGTTIAELCAAGKASILVPLPTAADDHQRKNAEVLAKAGAARMLLQKDVTPESLLEAISALWNDTPGRQQMEARARALAKPRALEQIAAIILRLSQ
jgi:UDP-N-acetylglucosamine--N-acetylmuramyl-(pentapeptide) pyrophosphoryl-undecaprenol N-acetylglucosamine transferase